MTDRVVIDFDRMDQLAEVLSIANGNIDAALVRLDAEVSQLRAGWTGEAAGAYVNAHTQWAASVAEMNRLLATIHSTTTAITDRHRDAEMKVQQLWR